MKLIEKKLKIDAQAFNQSPKQELLDNIMQNIKAETSINQKENTSVLKWLIPTGFAISALVLVALNLPKDSTLNNIEPILQISENNNHQISNKVINIDLIASSLETKFTNSIQKEQQAIVNDLNYIKSLIIL